MLSSRPAIRHTGHQAVLATFLAGLRKRAGLTFQELTSRIRELPEPESRPSAATLKRAAKDAGTVPKEPTVSAFVRGCGGGPAELRTSLRLWRLARTEERGVLSKLRAPAPNNVRDWPDLMSALAAAYEKAGAPPLRVVQKRGGASGGVLLLPLSTVSRIVNRTGRPADLQQYEAFLRGCGITRQQQLDQWRQAWKRTTTAQPGTSAAAVAHQNTRTSDTSSSTIRPVRRNASEHQQSFSPLWAGRLARLPVEELEVILAAGLTHLLESKAHRNGPSPGTTSSVPEQQGRPRPVQTRRCMTSTDGALGSLTGERRRRQGA